MRENQGTSRNGAEAQLRSPGTAAGSSDHDWAPCGTACRLRSKDTRTQNDEGWALGKSKNTQKWVINVGKLSSSLVIEETDLRAVTCWWPRVV